MRMSDPMMVRMNDWRWLRISNISWPDSEQTFHSTDNTSNGAPDYRTDRTCGLVPHECAMLDAVRNTLRPRRQRS